MIEGILDRERWNALVAKAEFRDFYYSYEYHQISKAESELPWMVHYAEEEGGILFPLLLRNINHSPYRDATSVYGYAGPLSYGRHAPGIAGRFQAALRELFLKEKIVSVFSRLHPYIQGQEGLLDGMGELEDLGRVVNIDLTARPEEQWSQVSRRFRSYINKARKTYRVRRAETDADLERFVALYQQTMKRLGAHPRYYFKKAYYNELWHGHSFRTEMLMAEDPQTGQVISAAMFVLCCDMVQYHLSGTDGAYIDLHPVKLLIDEMRLQATREGKRYFNLGGGIGGHEDSLFEFKSRFSKDYREFFIWKFIADEDRYRQLSEAHIYKVCNKDPRHCKEFFPCYRCDARIPQPPEGHGGTQ